MCFHTFILDDVIMYVQVHTAYDIRPGFFSLTIFKVSIRWASKGQKNLIETLKLVKNKV